MKFLTRISMVVGILLGTAAFAADPPATHGMLLFGEEKILLSHLPMFHNPHDYQVLLEVTFPDDAKNAYLKDRKDHPSETVYTFVPKRFILPNLEKKPFALEGAVFRGHFERGGKQILSAVKTGVPRILFFKKLDPKEKAPASSTYLLFGAPGELFIAHLITGQPNFDHVARVHLAGTVNPIPEGRPFVTISFPEETEDRPVEKVFRTGIRVHESGSNRIMSQLQTLYLEKDELASVE